MKNSSFHHCDINVSHTYTQAIMGVSACLDNVDPVVFYKQEYVLGGIMGSS